ncbi:MAG TPA: hypothetical protein VK973_05235, partial [Arenicellales bacterium]|nr:hypothetical protein [Arenicellales bacterium]
MSRAAHLPPRGRLALLFAVSAGMLAFEVLLVRLFEFSHWHHFAGLTISLALLGMGAAGSYLALRRRPAAGDGDGPMVAGAAIQAGGTLAVLALHSQVALRPLFAAWDLRELGLLLLVDFAAFVPFFGAGLVIGHAFSRWPGASPRVYAANLFGSGAGSLAASVLLTFMDVGAAMALVALLPAAGLLLVALRPPARTAAASGVLLGAVAIAAVLHPPAPAVSDFKALSGALEPADARIIEQHPGMPGRLSVVRSQSQRFAPGLSLAWSAPVPSSDAVIIGSDELIPMPVAFPAPTDHIAASLVGLPLRLRPGGDVLVLGTSAWQTQVAAASRALTWVEPDGRLLELAARRGLARPAVRMVEDGAYRYLAAGKRRFDLISLDAAFAGGDSASEDYLLTRQGLAAALGRLNSGGLLALPLELSVPPRRFPRGLATLRAALASAGAERPGRHIAALRGMQSILLMASPAPMAAGDLAQIRRFAERWRFDLVWLPDMAESEANRYHRLDAPIFHRAARAMLEGGVPPAAALWFHTGAADASRPYFWRNLSWQRIPDFLRAMGHQRALSYLDWSLLLTAASAVLVVLLAAVLILAPLGRLPPSPGTFSRASVALYFACLGLGYMLLELAVFQRAILFLGEPVLTAALVFAVFLVGSGVGSAGAPTTAGRRDAARVFLPIAAGLALCVVVLWPLADTILAVPRTPRMVLLAAALAPLTWAMGRPFPWALSQLAGQGRRVPWAWAINGFASVVAAALATLVSVQWGQPVTAAAAVAC